ncbi:MAG: ferritin-like domain-containing protein [Pseudomonadota bacterium]
MTPVHHSLRHAAIEALSCADLDGKVELTRSAYAAWSQRRLSLRDPRDPPVPDTPGRPDKPLLVSPTQVRKRSLSSEKGRFALLHALAHIELNAIDLALDIVARFATEPLPRSFFDGWLSVADDEARHFTLLRERLSQLGGAYGDLPAHNGLWEAAHDTREHLHARLAIVPMVLEARGLDVTPSMVAHLERAGDIESAAILSIIYEDEKTHVAVGAKWFRFYCMRDGVVAADAFQSLVRRHFRGSVRPPFNEIARAAAGLTPSFYRSLTAASRS